MPLIFLLMRRALAVIEQGKVVVLGNNELRIITGSISVIYHAVVDRVLTLQGEILSPLCFSEVHSNVHHISAVHKLHNLNEKDQLRRFFYGIVCGP